MAGVAVIALGGNALVPARARGNEKEQREKAGRTASALVQLVGDGWRLLLVHGNGPQVGHLLIQQELSEHEVPPLGLPLCVAATQGTLGHVIEDAVRTEFANRGMEERIVTILTSALVSEGDPAFDCPTKPIGPYLTAQKARHVRMVEHQPMVKTEEGYRRIVPSPEPVEVLPHGIGSYLLEKVKVVIAGGGGGVPIVRKPDGRLVPVDAVVDKDRMALLLAREVRAEALVFLTGVPYVYLDFGTETQRPLERVGVAELRRYHEEGQFPPGSMGPKIATALDFLDGGGDRVVITDLEDVGAALSGTTGTHILAPRT